MADATQNDKETRRVVVHVPLNVCTFLHLVAMYQNCTKADLYDKIWRAGFAEYFGVAVQKYDDLEPTPLPRGAARPRTPVQLADALLRS